MNNLPCPHCSTELKEDEGYHFCPKCGFIVKIEWLKQASDYYIGLTKEYKHTKTKFKVNSDDPKLDKVYSTSINSLGMQK